MKCSHPGCEQEVVYCIEWWGAKSQRDECSLADERYSCTDIKHLVKLSKHPDYNRPDKIYNIGTCEEQETILLLVNQCLDLGPSEESIDDTIKDDDAPRQMKLL